MAIQNTLWASMILVSYAGKGFVSNPSPVDLEVPKRPTVSQKARYPQEENEYRTPRMGPISVVACQLLPPNGRTLLTQEASVLKIPGPWRRGDGSLAKRPLVLQPKGWATDY